ncbi:hypothetical protein BKA70DRAFT_1216368 [Coprinopsis sp. MPI-PUGE-AT-0042]|nr:hypothetical protein BKA70DRAFT_1216368 [Coprinopsis sp. MPI-PUGE-AT-0042]
MKATALLGLFLPALLSLATIQTATESVWADFAKGQNVLRKQGRRLDTVSLSAFHATQTAQILTTATIIEVRLQIKMTIQSRKMEDTGLSHNHCLTNKEKFLEPPSNVLRTAHRQNDMNDRNRHKNLGCRANGDQEVSG